MKKWFEKGKIFLDNILDDNKEQKKEIQSINQQQIIEQSNNQHHQTIEIKKNKLLQKAFGNEKLHKFSQKLLNFQNLTKENEHKIQNSIFYKNNFSPIHDDFQKYYKQNLKNFDFLSKNTQEFFEQYNKPQEELINQQPIFLISIVYFHHKKGPIIEFAYPQNFYEQLIGKEQDRDKIYEELTYYALPDGIHNKNEDCLFFTLEHKNNNNQTFLLFGVSYFKQIEVSEQMKNFNSDLTRNKMQKAICILSIYPLYGYLMSRLSPTISAYFNQKNLSDFDILINAYDSINTIIVNSEQNIEESEIFLGVSPKTLIYQFKDNVILILKALILEKKVLVFSLHSQSCSNFILSLLSLLPGMLHFRFSSKKVNLYELSYRNEGFPLRIFDDDKRLLQIYFTIQNMDQLTYKESYLIGTTNFLIKMHKKTQADIIIDIDKQTIEFQNEEIKKCLKLNKSEKQFIEQIIKNINNNIVEEEKQWKTFNMFSLTQKWTESNDYLRQLFYNYYRNLIIELEFFYNNLKQVENDFMQVLLKNENLFVEEQDFEIQPKQIEIFDGETIMVMGVHHEESRSSKFIQQMRQILMQNKEQIKQYNINFYNQWADTKNFKFWFQNHSHSNLLYKAQENQQIQKQNILFTLQHGDMYLGKFITGKKQGKGKYYDALNQRQIDTNYDKDIKNGKTMIKSLHNDYFFEGNYVNNQMHGYGYLKTKEYEYKGHFFNNQFDKFGEYFDILGNKYEGEFKNSKKCGMGKYRQSNGSQYVGNFKNDSFHDKGQLVTQDGNIYNGTFKEGKKHGLGEYYGQNEQYKGEFQNDLFNGQGVYINNEKQEFQGLFINGQLSESEQCIIKFKNGDVYNGQVRNFLPHGKGLICKPDSSIVEGQFQNGILIKQHEQDNLQEIK